MGRVGRHGGAAGIRAAVAFPTVGRTEMRVGVIGTGHVGLVTCASFAAFGHEVVGMDSDSAKIESLNKGAMPFYEPGLAELLAEQTAA